MFFRCFCEQDLPIPALTPDVFNISRLFHRGCFIAEVAGEGQFCQKFLLLCPNFHLAARVSHSHDLRSDEVDPDPFVCLPVQRKNCPPPGRKMNGISAKQWVVFIIDQGIHRVLLVIGEEQKITIYAAADTGISPGLQVEQGLYNQSAFLICLRHLVNGARGFRAVAPGTGQVIDEHLGGQDGN